MIWKYYTSVGAASGGFAAVCTVAFAPDGWWLLDLGR